MATKTPKPMTKAQYHAAFIKRMSTISPTMRKWLDAQPTPPKQPEDRPAGTPEAEEGGAENEIKTGGLGISCLLPKLRPARSTSRLADLDNELRKTLDPYVVSQAARAKQDKGNRQHEQVVSLLVDYLGAQGIPSEESLFVDLFAYLPNGPAIFEVKSVHSQNEIAQARAAVAQLYEYRYRYSEVAPELQSASLWAVFSAPVSDWLQIYLKKDRNIGVLWVEDDAIKGLDLSE